jgi:hypothetical protein
VCKLGCSILTHLLYTTSILSPLTISFQLFILFFLSQFFTSFLLLYFYPVLYLTLPLTPSSAHNRYLNIPIIAEIQERVEKIQNDLKIHVHKTFREIGQVGAPF